MNPVTVNILTYVAFMIVSMVSSIVLHEAGHMIFLKQYTGKKIRLGWHKESRSIRCGEEHDYDGLEKWQYNRIIMGGIALGALPLILYLLVNWITMLTSIPLLVAYYRGCRADIMIWDRLNNPPKKDSA